MVYLYDSAIVENLRQSFNQDESAGQVVKVVEPDNVVSVIAQATEDQLSFPIVALTREPDYQIDKMRTNFTAIHQGVEAVIDPETNNIYSERVIPITLEYSLTVLATNVASMDEITRELLFKYSTMYFLAIKVPYESKRTIRFAIEVDRESAIQRSSSVGAYLKSGTLYQTIIPLKCQGTVFLHYVPFHLKKIEPVFDLSSVDLRKYGLGGDITGLG